ncbi:MAG: alanine racemase [Pseudomonadota bacterium]
MLLSDLQTPCLIADLRKLRANATRMLDRVREHGIGLRPHLKTTKSVDMALLAHDGARGPITVSTLKEAEYFAAHGFKDITYAVAVTPNKLSRAADLLESGVDLKLLVSGLAAGQALVKFSAPAPFPLMLEIDSGEHRTGFLPDDDALLQTAKLLAEWQGARCVGLLTHGGHSYNGRSVGDFQRVAAEERAALLKAQGRLSEIGLEQLVLSSGSTPTATFGTDFSGIDEVRPGVYLAGDLFQAQLGTVALDNIAVSVLASVIAHDPGRNKLMIDAGGLALSKDRSTAQAPVDQGYGLVVRDDGSPIPGDPVVAGVHQEHGEVTSTIPLPFDALPVGSAVRVLPNHVCMTAAAYDRYFVVDGGEPIVAEWEKVAGW